jgi:hypothetical protein
MIGGPADGLEYEIAEPLPQDLRVQGEPAPVERWRADDPFPTYPGYRVEWAVHIYMLERAVDPGSGQERFAYVCRR